MDDAQWAKIEAKRERQAHFRALDRAARNPKRSRQPKAPPAPRKRSPRPSAATGSPRGGSAQRYTHCSGCGRPLRPRGVTLAERPGTVLNQGGGKCKPCLQDSPRKGIIGRPATRSRVCVSCDRPMRMSSRETLATHPGTVPYGKDNKCRTCAKRG